MIILAVGLVVATTLALGLMFFGNNGYDRRHFFAEVCGLFLCVGTALTGVFYVWQGWDWLAAEQKANIINREYGTNYTQKEVYFASDVIDTVRELDRKRIEVNGDLMREEKDK